jgi:heat shock protein HslJ
MSAWLLAYAAAAMQPPGSSPSDYFASGSEPFWGLEIRGRQLRFSPNDGSESDDGIVASLPRRQPVRGGYRLVTRRFTVLVRHRVCGDEAGRNYRDTVTVTLRGRRYLGCGGTLLPPETLEQTDWRIEAIGSARVDGDNYVMGFYEGRIRAQGGCNQLTGPFRERGNRFTAGPIAATRMACPGERMAHERAVLRLLGGPVMVSFPAGDVMVLTGSGVTIRLRRV